MTYDIVRAIQGYYEHTYTSRELVSAYGGGKTAIGRLAAEMIGKPYERGLSKDKEYQAARRNVERYLQGTRHANKQTQEKLNTIGKQKAPIKPPKKIHMDGTIAVNGTGEQYERDRTVDIPPYGRSLSDDAWNDLVAYASEGDEEGCWNVLAQEYGVDTIEMDNDGTLDFE